MNLVTQFCSSLLPTFWFEFYLTGDFNLEAITVIKYSQTFVAMLAAGEFL